MTTFAATVPAPRSTVPAAPRQLPRTPRWWGTIVLVALWTLGVGLIAQWVAGGGVQSLVAGGAETPNSVGRLFGLVGSALILVQVAMMARIPLVERSFGQDTLARWHRVVGFTSLSLILLHVEMVLLAEAVAAGTGFWTASVDLVLTFPGMLLALAGTLALVMVAVTSIRAARRRVRYESWHLLHLYAYLGAGLALPHQLWSGTEFVAHPVATVVWWTVWAAVLVATLVFRVGLPLVRTVRHRLVVGGTVVEGPGVVSVHLTGRDLHRLPVRPGQFFLLRFLDRPGWTRAHPYSLSAAPTGDRLRFTVKSLGDGSAEVASLTTGTRVAIEGPYGRLTEDARTRRPVLLVGCGIGITPLVSLLGGLDLEPGEAVLLYRVRSTAEAVLAPELEELAARRGARLVLVAGPRVPGRDSWMPDDAAHLTDVQGLLHLVPDVAHRDVFVCGPDEWSETFVAAAHEAGVEREQLHREVFAW